MDQYRALFERLEGRFKAIEGAGNRELAAVVADLRDWLRRELERGLQRAGETQPLVVEDHVLRIMTAHVRLLPSQHEFFVEGNDTVLEAALRLGAGARLRLFGRQLRSVQGQGAFGSGQEDTPTRLCPDRQRESRGSGAAVLPHRRHRSRGRGHGGARRARHPAANHRHAGEKR